MAGRDRTSRPILKQLFAMLCKALGEHATDSSSDKGGWHLSHESGGWRIVEFAPSGGERHPFGERVRSAGEMADVMRFALMAIGHR